MARIAELCELVNGFAFKPSDWATKGLPIVRIQNLNDETAKFNYYSGMTQDKYIINSGELLFSWSGTPGTSFGAFVWSRGRALLNQHIFKVLPKPWVNKHYLMYALNGSIEKIISKAHGGVGLQHITKTELEDIEIVIPDYKSQVKIACTLERIDSLLKLRKQQVSKLDELVKSRFIEMFGNPVTNPKEYKKCKLGEVVKLQGGYAFKSSDYVENGIRLVQIANVNKDNLDWDIINYLPDRYMKMYGRFALSKGDIVMAMTRPIVKSINSVKIAVVGGQDVPSLLNQRVGKFVFSSAIINDRYLLEFCKSDYFKNFVDAYSQNALQPNISSAQVESIEILLPPIVLQNQFADFVHQVDKSKSELKQSLEKLETLKKALMQQYFG